MFKSLLGLAEDALTIVTAPVRIVIDTTRAVTKPLAEVAKDTADGVEELVGHDRCMRCGHILDDRGWCGECELAKL